MQLFSRQAQEGDQSSHPALTHYYFTNLETLYMYEKSAIIALLVFRGQKLNTKLPSANVAVVTGRKECAGWNSPHNKYVERYYLDGNASGVTIYWSRVSVYINILLQGLLEGDSSAVLIDREQCNMILSV